MSSDNRILFYKKELPFYSIPALLIAGLVFFAVATFLGLLMGIFVVTFALGALIVRLLLRPYKSRGKRFEDGGRTILLEKGEYEVLEKKR